MKLSFLGTGDARQVPVYGCHCQSCYRARVDKTKRRCPSSLLLESGEVSLLIDAGQSDLAERFPPGTLDAILLTHYHMDHIAGLFHLRWGLNTTLPVFGPDDIAGSEALQRHAGILDFKKPLEPFTLFSFGSINITPIPLSHTRPCLGYGIEQFGRKLAYLTDTAGLCEASLRFLSDWQSDLLIVDCTYPPSPSGEGVDSSLTHNDWTSANAIIQQVKPSHSWLTHISHEMDEWLLTHHLPAGVSVATDNTVIEL